MATRRAPHKQAFEIQPEPETEFEKHELQDAEGNKFRQRKIDMNKPVEEPKVEGKTVRVYNKVNANLHHSLGVLEALSEGEILESDLQYPGVANTVVKVAK